LYPIIDTIGDHVEWGHNKFWGVFVIPHSRRVKYLPKLMKRGEIRFR